MYRLTYILTYRLTSQSKEYSFIKPVPNVQYYPLNICNKFEMFQTIISFINLIPLVFKLAYVQHIKLKSMYNL